MKKFSKPTKNHSKFDTNYKGLVGLPFYPKITHQIANILKTFNLKCIFSPVNKLKFSNLKDPIDSLNNWGIYNISCQCGLSYIGQTKRALRIRLKEHQNYVKNMDVKKIFYCGSLMEQ